MYIGKTFSKDIATSEYFENSMWCLKNKAIIRDKGGYYEIEAIPEPTAEELAEQELQKKKADRAEAVSRITVEVDGMEFDGDEKAQERMSRTVSIATANGMPMTTETTWVLADNTIAQVTLQQLAKACLLAGQKQTELWTVPYQNEETNAGNE